MSANETHDPRALRSGASSTVLVVALAVAFAGGIAAGVTWQAEIRARLGLSNGENASAAGVLEPAGKGELWTCGMHPQVLQDRPGTCPICGMALTPVVYGNDASAGSGVTIDPTVVQNMGLRVATVEERSLVRHLRAVGTLEEAEPNRFDVNLRVDGWIDAIHADFEGKHVARGEPLFDLYSPALQLAAEELIAARRMRDTADRTTADALYAAAARKLELHGVSQEEIKRLATMHRAPRAITFRSPATGHVLHKMVQAGAAVKAGDLALRIVDHTVLWLEVRVFERDLPRVHIDQRVTASIDGLPGEVIDGTVIFVHPHLDPRTRTAAVRIALPNPDLSLRPGMYAKANLEVEVAARALVVPREAVIDTGMRQIAFVALDAGHFEPREVVMGAEGDDGLVQVLTGLALGERVVTSGQFLLDAESRTREAIQKFLQQGTPTSSAPAAPTEGPLEGVSEEWKLAADEAVGAYLALAERLGMLQESDEPVDPRDLAGAARALREAGRDESQAAIADELLAAAEAMQGLTISEQRGKFLRASDAVLELAERSPRAGRLAPQVFLARCPMVDGQWLQAGEEIANPYYATTMKACGEVVRPIPIPR